MATCLIYLQQPNCIYLYLWVASLFVANAQEMSEIRQVSTGKGTSRPLSENARTPALTDNSSVRFTPMSSEPSEVSALGRPLFPGMLYDCHKDSFVPGVTLWDVKSLSEDLDSRPQLQTDLKFSSSDSLSSKSSLLDVSASLKASFLGGLVEVGGSAKYLRDTKSSNQQSRITIYYSETSRFEQLTMTQLRNITYPQVFDQKTATHVITAVLYGAKAFMVFDQTFSEEEDKQKIEGELNVMVKKIPSFSIEGKGSANITDSEKKMAKNIGCTFHGDFHLERNPTTYMEAVQTYKQLPTLLKKNPQNVVPVKVWLYPLYLLDNKAARLMREISTNQVSITEDIIEELEEAERTCNDLFRNTLVNDFIDIEERLQLFQKSLNIYKTVLLKAVSTVLPGIRGGGMDDKSLKDILKIHYDSPFNSGMLNQWLNDAKSELQVLTSYIKKLEGIKIVDSDSLNTILHDPDINVVVCFTFTSLKYEDTYISTLKEFLKSDKFKELDGNEGIFSVSSVRKWFNDPDFIIKMRENLSLFRSFSKANKDDKRIRFIISAFSDHAGPGCSIYLYENGNLTDKQFQPVSKPPPPIVKNILEQTVSLELQKSPTGETVQYRVGYKQEKADPEDDEQWLVINTAEEEFNLTGLESGKQYLIRYRIVSKVGVSEASDTVSTKPSSAQLAFVGGTGGDYFSLRSTFSTIKKISITCKKSSASHVTSLNAIFHNKQNIGLGQEGIKKQDLQIELTDKIVTATLWPNKKHSRFGGLEFLIEQSNGKKKTVSVGCGDLGEAVSIDVKSGKCHGIGGRSG